MTNTNGCSCQTCIKACLCKPGWFLPEEVNAAAKHMNLPLQEFFDKFLGVDWWQGCGEDDIFLLTPATNIMTPGGIYPYNPQGRCIFLTNDQRCSIYPVRPHECRQYIHTESYHATGQRHQATAMAWKEHQQIIKDLLRYEPTSTEPEDFAEMLGLMLRT